MRKGPTSQRQNAILAALQAEDAEILTRILTPVELERRRYLAHRDRRIEYVYFIDSGVASVIADASSVRSVEVGMVGSEGLTGLGALMGASKSPYDTFMQVAGRGRRCQPAALKQAMDNSPALRDCIMHYAHAFMLQIAQTALSNARGKLEERLARWLLMVHDRTDGDEVQLTHDFLATMLGVRTRRRIRRRQTPGETGPRRSPPRHHHDRRSRWLGAEFERRLWRG
ncbi:MAG: Crp/Fnr family transcriptional regulator [Hyphomonadaceae bacterium]